MLNPKSKRIRTDDVYEDQSDERPSKKVPEIARNVWILPKDPEKKKQTINSILEHSVWSFLADTMNVLSSLSEENLSKEEWNKVNKLLNRGKTQFFRESYEMDQSFEPPIIHERMIVQDSRYLSKIDLENTLKTDFNIIINK